MKYIAMVVKLCDGRSMAMDFCTEVVAAALPLPESDEDLPSRLEDVDEARELVGVERVRRVEQLQVAWDEGVIRDPLLAELAQARYEREQADAKIRRLVAYGRQFARPRPYGLAQLATAAGMSVSGVRTCYSDIDTGLVAHNIGRRPPTSEQTDTEITEDHHG